MYQLPMLPYDYTSLEPFIDEKTMRIHHDKHHAAYVDNLNKALGGLQQDFSVANGTDVPIEQLVSSLDQVPESIRGKVRNHGGGHVNHSLFWQIMCPPSVHLTKSKPGSALGKAIDVAFGDYEKFQEQFTASAMGRFGSGWAWLSVSGNKLLIEDTPNQDSPLMTGHTPVLGIDVWEHAYYLKYQNLRADYIKAWWNVINWDFLEKRFSTLA